MPRSHLGSQEVSHTLSVELAHGGSPGLVMDTAQTAAFWHTPGGCDGPAVSLLRRIIDLHVGGALGQVFAVMAQAILGDLDGVEVALRAPLSGERHAWFRRDEIRTRLNLWSTCLLFKLLFCVGETTTDNLCKQMT